MCGGTTGGVSVEGVDLATQAVIQGTVVRAGQPLAGAYVRLLDRTGEFVAEVPTSATGQFRFFAAPGSWTVRALAPRSAPAERPVVAQTGQIAEVEVRVDS